MYLDEPHLLWPGCSASMFGTGHLGTIMEMGHPFCYLLIFKHWRWIIGHPICKEWVFGLFMEHEPFAFCAVNDFNYQTDVQSPGPVQYFRCSNLASSVKYIPMKMGHVMLFPYPNERLNFWEGAGTKYREVHCFSLDFKPKYLHIGWESFWSSGIFEFPIADLSNDLSLVLNWC